ncbi:MAG: Flp pilus assembly protein TadD [Kiritimatiellia bacterium]
MTPSLLRCAPALLALALLAGPACNSRARKLAEPAPRWSTEEGKQEVRLEIAEKMLGLGYTEDAQSLLTLAREDGVRGPEIDYLQGRALFQEGLMTEAEQMLLSAGTHLKRDPRIHRTLGLLYAATQETERAVTSFQRSLDLDESDAATWNNLGFLQFSAQDTQVGISSMRRAVQLDGTNTRYRRNLGFALFHNGETAEAYTMFRAAGSAPDAWYNMGLARELSGDVTGAITGYEKAVALAPTHNKAVAALSRLETTIDLAPGSETP